jgi:hypothetical protein
MLKLAGKYEPALNNIITRGIQSGEAVSGSVLLMALTNKLHNYINAWVAKFTSDQNVRDLQADAVIAGAYVYSRLENMIYLQQH